MYDLSIFDRITCLCLDRRRNDWTRIDKEFGQYGGKIERFIVGKGEILPKAMYNFIDPIVPPVWNGNTGNAHCCYLAHREILKKAKQDGVNRLLMLEDDATLTFDFAKVFNNAMEELEGLKWDMLYLGANHTFSRTRDISPHLLKCLGGTYCFHSVVINQQNNDIIQTLLDLPANGPFDLLTALYIQPRYECLAVYPSISLQKPGISYVIGSIQDYTHYFNSKGDQSAN